MKNVTILFSPNGGCTKAIIKEIDAAKFDILILCYSFTNLPITKALQAAVKRGVRVQAVIDSKQKSPKMDMLKASGAYVRYDGKHAIAHNKVMVIDNVVVTGSFNFTYAAENQNAENVVIIHDKEIARMYRDNWELHYNHSVSASNKSMSKTRR